MVFFLVDTTFNILVGVFGMCENNPQWPVNKQLCINKCHHGHLFPPPSFASFINYQCCFLSASSLVYGSDPNLSTDHIAAVHLHMSASVFACQ